MVALLVGGGGLADQEAMRFPGLRGNAGVRQRNGYLGPLRIMVITNVMPPLCRAVGSAQPKYRDGSGTVRYTAYITAHIRRIGRRAN